MIIQATTLHQRVRGGDPSNTLAIWMRIKPMLTRPKGRGLTTKPDIAYRLMTFESLKCCSSLYMFGGAPRFDEKNHPIKLQLLRRCNH
jgi:hypothetical protein